MCEPSVRESRRLIRRFKSNARISMPGMIQLGNDITRCDLAGVAEARSREAGWSG